MSDVLNMSSPGVESAGSTASRFIWYELMALDQDAAIRFYTSVIGWTAADFDNPQMGDFRYTIISANDQGLGCIMTLTEAMREGGARPGWIGYIWVGDTDSKVREIEAAGGRILMAPGDIPSVGRFALVTDPGGAPFYLLTPSPCDGQQPLPDLKANGHFGWHELQSSLGEKAVFDFYARLFGWETLQEMDMGPMGTYRIFGESGVQLGGMMDKPADSGPSQWGFYVNVDSIDPAVDRIRANGGTISRDPHQVPDGSWIVHAVDPQGAAFALTSERR